MQIDLKTVIMTIINFIVLLIILKYLFWGKIAAVIDKRQKDIVDILDDADAKMKQGEEYSRTNKALLDGAKEEGKKITEARKHQADKIYDEILESARVEASAMRERAEKDIAREMDKAKFEIKEQVIELALVVSQKALDKELNEAEHRRLIDSFIDEVV
ncbi:MAG: F0F1 ATP synthase subunit B [Sarcina sp.]